MPRSLTRLRQFATVVLLVVAGCATPPPVIVVESAPPAKPALPPPVLKWLRWQDSVSTMTLPQLNTALEGMATPGNANQLFYYGLLNQQSDVYTKWVAARDVFRDLQQNEKLTAPQRQLAGVLERFNQSRINWFHRRDELRVENEKLQQQVADQQAQNLLLEQKIQAITDLEATISTRKEE
jgi:hypothetical protein